MMSTAKTNRRHVVLPDKRCLSLCRYGKPGGHPVIALHGTPGSGLKFAFCSQIAADLGLDLICPDRWGYGDSQAPASRNQQTFLQYASDIAALLDALEIEKCVVWGVSGGGPFTVAIAGALSTRVTALALFAPVGPIAQGDQFAPSKMSSFHNFCFHILPRVPGAIATVFTALRMQLAIAPDFAIRMVTTRAARSDRAVMCHAEKRRELALAFQDGLSVGVSGPVIDMTMFRQPWRVRFLDIRCCCQIWQGTADQNVPISRVEVLAKLLPHTQLKRMPGEGHFWIVEHAEDVLQWLHDQCARDGEAMTSSSL